LHSKTRKQCNNARNQQILRYHYIHVDDHNPPHFHVWYDDYQAEVTIKDGIVRGEMPRRALRLVYEWLDLHRDELMENWERLSNSEAAQKIDPLK